MKANEVILAYSFGVRDFSRETLRDADLRRANLRDADLRDANLGRADLRDANLRDANLRRANLRDANLSDANLSRANLSDANLSRANLSDADLRGADLSNANLSGSNLPSPTIFLLAEWEEVSEWLCAALMRYDASNHDEPKKFVEWKDGGECPYSLEKYQRNASFSEKKKLFSMDAPLLSARQLMQCLLFEKCKYYDEGETE